MSHHVFWFRRDLRLEDNAGLYHALKAEKPVIPLFIFDKEILDPLPERDARVAFIHQQLHRMQQQLRDMGSSLFVFYGQPVDIWKKLVEEHNIQQVYTNHDYEPYARKRDEAVSELLEEAGIAFHTFKDQVIFEKEQILTNAGTPYSVFTHYGKKWKANLSRDHYKPYPTSSYWQHFIKTAAREIPALEEMGFKSVEADYPSDTPDHDTIKVYDQHRNFPAEKGTTRMGIHLRFGTISVRKLVAEGVRLNETYLNELIWREFYMQILWNFPYVAEGPFRKEYAAIPWRDDEEQFERWCQGQTGFPIVDAGMRELNATGYMHNRVRMIVASFLVKDLLINWQWGEAYFAEKLLDFELSSNNGGWQWAAGCGTDAAPYFRIFNPESQMKKFDPKLRYVNHWVPEHENGSYPEPIVNHKEARKRCLDVYKSALPSND